MKPIQGKAKFPGEASVKVHTRLLEKYCTNLFKLCIATLSESKNIWYCQPNLRWQCNFVDVVVVLIVYL